MFKFFEKMASLDRRWTFLAIGISAIIPFLFPMNLAIQITPEVKSVFDHIEGMAGTGKPLLLSFDFDPGTDAELGPMAHAIFTHTMKRDIPLIVINFIPHGVALAEVRLKKAAEPLGKVHGEDYVFFGNKPAYANIMVNLANDFRIAYNTDYYGNPIDDLPLMEKVKNYDDLGLVICLSGTRLIEFWIVFGQGPYGFDYAIGCTAVSATEQYPFLQSGQAIGLLGGMKGAAEYEKLMLEAGLYDKLGDAAKGMDSQSLCHLVIIGFILMGNIAYLAGKRRRR